LAVLVDDHLLLACLRGYEPIELSRRRGTGRLYTTGTWYHRLCRATAAESNGGKLSGPLAMLSGLDAMRARHAVARLPENIGLISLRRLAWPMAEVLREHRANLLALEALAAAKLLEATICVASSDEGPGLRAAAESMGIPMVVVTP
jgi:hypothetical protein